MDDQDPRLIIPSGGKIILKGRVTKFRKRKKEGGGNKNVENND